jgi:phosphohistidine phosphatase SixA
LGHELGLYGLPLWGWIGLVALGNRGSIVRRFVVPLILVLLASLFPQQAVARDLAVWDKLKSTNPRGYVLLMRHALAPGVGDPVNFKLGDCSTQRNLSAEGRQDARDIGEWIKRRDVPIYRVESSRWCRARETAELLGIGAVRANRNLDSLFNEVDPIGDPQTAKIRKRIIDHRQKNGLLVMVGHFVNVSALTGVGLESGEGVLVRANSKGEIKVVGYTPVP